MTSFHIARRALSALLAGTTLLLAACGGGNDNNDSGPTQWRVLNLSSELTSLDVYTDNDKRFADVAADALAPYATIE